MAYEIKRLPEDFVVDEQTSIKPGSKGRYCYFWLCKRGLNTEQAINIISRYVNISRKRFGYAGSKDRNAVTRQLCSVLGRIRPARIKGMDIMVAGYGDEPISLGDLEGNSFTITVRGVTKKPRRVKQILNLFDEQRFGRNNADVGLAIVKRDFKRAVELVVANDNSCAEQIRDYLAERRSDYVNALRLIPKKLRMMYVHALQSRIWNETAVIFSKSKRNVSLPVVGFATEIKDKRVKEAVNKIVKYLNLNQRDFVIREMPELSGEGGERELFASVKGLKVGKLKDDELDCGKKKCVISFSLPKGSYATIVVREMFS